jgi:hypothetical protein
VGYASLTGTQQHVTCQKKQMIEYMIQDLLEIIAEDQNVEYDKAMALNCDKKTFAFLFMSDYNVFSCSQQ